MKNSSSFTTIISPKKKFWEIDYQEIYKYRGLLSMLVKRNFTTLYKQTILGPLWLFLNPLLNSVLSTVIFGNLARLSTDGVPQYLFYLANNSIWAFFSNCVVQLGYVFTANAGLFGKVYFPRLISPISQVITDILKFCIQFLLFLLVFSLFLFTGAGLQPNWYIACLPLLILQLSLLAFGVGCIISSITVKYRDLTILINFGMTAWMYLSPVVYPMSTVGGIMRQLMWLNPITPILEIFRYGFFGVGEIKYFYWGISWISTIVLATIGVFMYNKTEKNYLDTI